MTSLNNILNPPPGSVCHMPTDQLPPGVPTWLALYRDILDRLMPPERNDRFRVDYSWPHPTDRYEDAEGNRHPVEMRWSWYLYEIKLRVFDEVGLPPDFTTERIRQLEYVLRQSPTYPIERDRAAPILEYLYRLARPA